MKTFSLYLKKFAKLYKLQMLKAIFYVRKMTVTEYVLSAIGATLLKVLRITHNNKIYRNISCNSWSAQLATGRYFRVNHETNKIARTTNIVFLGTNQTNLFHYQNFGLEQITLRRNGLPYQVQQLIQKIINVSSSTHYQCWVCLHCGLGITLDNYQQHCLFVLILLAHRRQLMFSCNRKLLTA